jgi:hypothetical protein
MSRTRYSELEAIFVDRADSLAMLLCLAIAGSTIPG